MRRSFVMLVGFIATVGFTSALAAETRRSEPQVSPSLEVGLWTLADQTTAPKPPVWPTGPCRQRSARAQFDRPDVHKEDEQVHIVYLLPADMEDEKLDTNGVLQCSVLAWNEWFEKQSGGLSWRLDMFSQGGRKGPLVDVTFVRSDRPASEIGGAAAVEEELLKAGLIRGGEYGRKKFLAYVATSTGSQCGSAQYPLYQLGVGDIQDWTRIAAVYMFSSDGCGGRVFGAPGSPSWSESIAMQELIHTEGVVPLGAPHGCSPVVGDTIPIPTHVCTPGLVVAEGGGVEIDPERVDVMYPYGVGPLSENVLDRDNDDYFNHSLPLRDLGDSPWLVRS